MIKTYWNRFFHASLSTNKIIKMDKTKLIKITLQSYDTGYKKFDIPCVNIKNEIKCRLCIHKL